VAKIQIAVLLWIGFALYACQNKEPVTVNENLPFQRLNEDKTGIAFVNKIFNTDSFNIFNYRNFYNGGGVALADFNKDDLLDVFFSANMGANKLYLNQGNFEFEDVSQLAGIQLSDKWSTGIAIVDINADGWNDIYVCNAGYQKGTNQKNTLFINQQDGSFIDQAEAYNLADNGYTTHAAFFDYDKDGDLDVYILNNSFIPVNTLNYSNKRKLRAKDWQVKDFLKGGGDKLMRNDGGTFVEVSREAGIYGSLIGFGLGVTVGDVNGDRWEDIYISNDFFERDYLYLNNMDGTFSEQLEQKIAHISHSSMGADMADINNDGHLDIFVTDMLPSDDFRLKTTTTFDNINLRSLKVKQGFYNQFMHNTLQLNQGGGFFSEISFYSGVAASDWSWGALLFDADNDALTDIFVCNGIYHDVINQDFIDFFANDVIQKMVLTGNKDQVDSIINKMPSVPIRNHFFKNINGLKFEDKGSEFGFTDETFSNGAAYGDLDNDGDLDLVINNVNQTAMVYENQTAEKFIGFELEYIKPNLQATGSKINLFANNKIYSKQLQTSKGFQSSVDHRIIFGLKNIDKIDSIIVYWHNEKYTRIEDFTINTYNKINFNKLTHNEVLETQKKLKTPTIFTKQKTPFEKHTEDDHIDFFYERNIPTQLSKEGPCLATGDINGDATTDVFIGAAAGTPAQLYLGTKSGFKKHQKNYWEKFKAFEDTAAEFADLDNDGDLDLMVCSGGNNPNHVAKAFMDRVYLNNSGNFELHFNAFPPNKLNTSTIATYDFDGDGDLDVFLGRRSVPGEYGLSPGSNLFVNNGKGQFMDVTQQIVPELSLAGMVTDAKWINLFDDEKKELVIVGEWMAPKILAFDGVKFNIIESELSTLSGWWQCIETTDIDKDGDEDLLLGNTGENFYLKASKDEPLFLWINDFDANGALDKIITKRIAQKDVPVFVKRDVIDQFPALKKENLLHNDFAKKSIQDLFDGKILAKSIIKKANYFASTIAINNGDGHFEWKAFNAEVQLSSVNAIVTTDLNGDAYDDLILGGNNTYLLPQFSMIDACKGKVLMNQKGKGFKVLPSNQTGLHIEGTLREFGLINHSNNQYLIGLINDDKVQLYEFNKKAKGR